MLVFIDTEFTDLREPYLVSAGFAAADGRELYFEISGVSPAVCSPFVREAVLPLLEGPALAPMQAAEQVSQFFGQYREQVTLFCDAPRYDLELLTPFLPGNLRWSFAVPSFESEAEEAAYNEALRQSFVDGLRRHHALDDARAARHAWLRK